MTLGQRIEERRLARKIRTQTALAGMAGITQSTMNGLINGPSRWSPHLVRIAKALGTTVEYLLGDTDDPDENAPPPPPPPEHRLTMMAVAWPTEQTLAAALRPLLAISRDMDEDELALELARQLPSVVATAQSARPSPARAIAGDAPEVPAMPDADSPQSRSGRRK